VLETWNTVVVASHVPWLALLEVPYNCVVVAALVVQL
jgi:hypothetical protein